MNIDELVKRISKTDGLSKTLGMHFISTPEPDTLQATMMVDERNRQPFGFLSGGVSGSCQNVAGISCPGALSGTDCRGYQRERYSRSGGQRGRYGYCLCQDCAQGQNLASPGRWISRIRLVR